VLRWLGSLTQWVVPLSIIVAWQVAVSSGLLSTHILPAPSDVVAAGLRLLKSGELLSNMWVSFARAMAGQA